MSKEFTSLGLMSGTSGDGVDASIIKTDGNNKYETIENKYFEYGNNIYQKIHSLKNEIHNLEDLKKFEKELNNLEKKITLFHAEVTDEISKSKMVDVVGFHGQTIYHNSKEKISKQLGDGNLLSQLIKKNVVFNFRNNDIKNGGEGAPLTPIFHQLIATKLKFDLPICILNIGGIANISIIEKPVGSYNFFSKDIGPGNCLIDTWVRKNSKKKYDQGGLLAKAGIKNEIIFEQAQELFSIQSDKKTLSLDVNDFDVSFVRGLTLEDGAATLTDLTSNIISSSILSLFSSSKKNFFKVIVCGGGRKNIFLMENIKKKISKNLILQSIDDYGVDGDFIESQAFAFLATRSILRLPISFPLTTGCKEPLTGGEIIRY
tara:strand:+ start:640 stop:1761 length:1122 start_codon:yes stop_codon:yes gene_type:complete